MREALAPPGIAHRCSAAPEAADSTDSVLMRCVAGCCRGSQIALDIVRAVLHMHSRRVLHLDLKAANVLLARDGTAKVADVTPPRLLRPVSVESSIDLVISQA